MAIRVLHLVVLTATFTVEPVFSQHPTWLSDCKQQLLALLPAHESFPHTDRATVSQDRKLVAVGYDSGEIHTFYGSSGKPKSRVLKNTEWGMVKQVFFLKHNGENYVMGTFTDGTAKIFPLDTKHVRTPVAVIERSKPIERITASDDGKLIQITTADGNERIPTSRYSLSN